MMLETNRTTVGDRREVSPVTAFFKFQVHICQRNGAWQEKGRKGRRLFSSPSIHGSVKLLCNLAL